MDVSIIESSGVMGRLFARNGENCFGNDKSGVGGTGLGRAIFKSIIEDHQGEERLNRFLKSI